MAKKEVFDHKITGPIMRSLRHIEVDRDSGAASFAEACKRLKEGELVGVYPEATISRSFEIKEFKSGAARMAIAADVPIVPHIVWGAQRIWTKGHPKNMWRPKVPISVAVGEPIQPTLPADRADRTAALAHAAPAASRSRTTTDRIRQASSGCRTASAAARRPWPRRTRWTPTTPPRRPPAASSGEATRLEHRASDDGTGFPHAGDRLQRGRCRIRNPHHLPRAGAHPRARRRSDGDQPHQLPGLDTRGAGRLQAAPATALHDQAGDDGGEDRQLPDQAHRNDSGGPQGRCRCVRGGRRPAARRRARGRVPGGDDQPQFRAQGVQDRSGADGDRRAGADHSADRLGRTPTVDQGPAAQAGPRQDPVHRHRR